MSSPKKAPRPPKRGNTDYTIDDFVNPTGFEHMFSFLNVRRPSDEAGPLPALVPKREPPDAGDLGAKDAAGSDLATTGAPTVSAPTVGAPTINALKIEAPTVGAPIVGALAHQQKNPEGTNVGAPPVSAPTEGALTEGAPTKGALIYDAAIETHLNKHHKTDNLHVIPIPAPPAGAPEEDPTIDASTAGAPPVDEMDFGPEPPIPVRRPRAVPAYTVQHGHTLLEQTIYQAIWQMARKNDPALGYREIEAGERTFARAVGTSYSNAQRCVAALAQKLAIDILPPLAPGRAKRIRIFDYTEVLRRRRAAGLTHVIRNRGGVTLVNSGSQTVGAPTVDAPMHAGEAPTVGAPTISSGAPSEPTSGAPPAGAHIRNKEISLGTTTTTFSGAPSPLIVRALRDATGKSDDDAAIRIAAACRANATDVTDEEVAAFIRERAAILGKAQKITNPMGLLIRMVPISCTGESLRQHRAEIEQARLKMEQRLVQEAAERRQLAQSLLDSGDEWPSEQLEWARGVLDGEGKP